MKNDTLGDRMKRHENVTRHQLYSRTPVIIRVDGQAFHTFTRGCDKPYDEDLHAAMNAATNALVREIQGAQFAYTQSDEISVFLRDWDTHTTEAWFDYTLQKIVSLSAVIASEAFNESWKKKNGKLARFDSRAFNLPTHEVCNYFIWRQQDAIRNSINGLAQTHFSQKQLNGKNTSDVQNMLIEQKNVNWDDLSAWKKRGNCVCRAGSVIVLDEYIPIFTEDRSYINAFLLED